MTKRAHSRGWRLAVLAMGAASVGVACTLLTPLSGLTGDDALVDADNADRAEARDAADGAPGDALADTVVRPDAGAETGCPCSFFGNAFPVDASASDLGSVELGIRFTSDVPAKVTAIRFYRDPLNTGRHTGTLWSGLGAVLATGTFVNETAEGWQTLTFPTPVSISGKTPYIASYHTASGHYAATNNFFDSGLDSPPLRATTDNGLFSYSDVAAPSTIFNHTNYWVDVLIE
jgi:hypothetical protein